MSDISEQLLAFSTKASPIITDWQMTDKNPLKP